MMYVSYILIVLAAICNAGMDILSFHYELSIFSKLNPKYWNPQISWKNKYIDGDPTKGFRTFLLIFDYPVFLTDFWHTFKSSMIVFIILSVVLYKPLFGVWIDFIVLGILWNLTFDVFYNHFFIKKQ